MVHQVYRINRGYDIGHMTSSVTAIMIRCCGIRIKLSFPWLLISLSNVSTSTFDLGPPGTLIGRNSCPLDGHLSGIHIRRSVAPTYRGHGHPSRAKPRSATYVRSRDSGMAHVPREEEKQTIYGSGVCGGGKLGQVVYNGGWGYGEGRAKRGGEL